jgi:hypothetical protein
MANNILIKILAENADFTSKLAQSKRQVSAFQEVGTKAFSGVTSVVGKLAAGVGLAMGGMEAFNRVMQSSQAIGDQWASVQQQATTAVNEFFYAIANGDFTNLQNGLTDLISRADEAYAAFDQLGNALMSYNIISAREAANVQHQMVTINDTTIDPKVRLDALNQARESITKMVEAADVVKNDITTALSAQVARDTGVSSATISLDDIYEAATVDATKGREAAKKYAQEQYAAYQEEVAKLNRATTSVKTYGFGEGQTTETIVDTAKRDAGMERLNAQYKQAIVYNALLNKYSDDELDNLGKQVQSYYAINQQADAMSRRLNQQEKRITGGTTTTPKSSETEGPTYEAGSLGKLQEQLKEANQALLTATTDEARQAAQALVDQYTRSIALIKRNLAPETEEVDTAFDMDKFVSDTIALAEKVDAETAKMEQDWADTVDKMSAKAEQLSEELGRGTLDAISTLNSGVQSLYSSWADLGDSISNAKNGVEAFFAVSNALVNTITTVESIVGVFERLNKTKEESAAISAALAVTNEVEAGATQSEAKAEEENAGALGTEMGLKLADAEASKQKANAQMEDAATGVMAAHSGIPFVGVALGLAGLASIIAAIATIPKFAEGGIATRATMGIFGEAGPEAIIPLSKINSVLGQTETPTQTVELKIKNTELVGIFQQYFNRRGRLS